MTSQNPKAPEGDLSLVHNPFIWGNIALLTGVPWLLALSMAGLAVGDPVFPAWFEIFILGFPAIALVAGVQWQQPISPFSLWMVSKPSESLSDRDRQILTLVKQHSNGWYVTGWIATAVAIVMSAIFCKIYISAPLAQVIAPFPAGLRLFGIVWAEICFLLSNILLQAGISALRIKLTAESELNGLKPFAVEKTKNSFTSIGWQSPQILKFFEEDVAIAQVSDNTPQVEVAEPDAIANTTENLIADPIGFVEDSEVVESLESLESTDIISEPEIQTIPQEEIIDFVEEVEDLEISAIAAEESVIEAISEPEIEQFVEESQIEAVLNQEIVQEAEELNPFELVEDEKSDIEVLDSTENASNLDEEIAKEPEQAEEAEELEAFEIPEEPDLTFLEIPDASPEPKLEEAEQAEANLELSDNVLEEQVTEDSEELESLEIVLDAVVEESANTTTTSDYKKSLDFLKRSRKTGGSQKKQGFGKSIKRDVVSSPNTSSDTSSDTVDTESVKATEQDAIPDAISIPIEQELDAAEIKTQDFDDELDELIAFNAYVENILSEYLEDNDDEALDEEISEQVDPSISFEPSAEAIAIAKENIEAFAENLPDLANQVPEDILEKTSSNDQEPKDSKYLVQEFLVDKFLARLEELNIADKANKANVDQATDISSNNEADEFADLEALLDGKPLTENPDTEDLRDRNS